MTIGFDARFMSVPGGIPRYCRELLCALTAQSPLTRFVVLVKKIPRDFPAPANIRWVETDIRWYGWREQILLGRLMNSIHDVDVWHIPHWNVPLTLRRPFVMTVHDFIFEEYPTHDSTVIARITFAVRLAAWRLIISSAISRARAVITVSSYVRERLIERFPAAALKSSVIHLGLSRLPKAQSPDTVIAQPFFLVVGNSYPHNNHELVFKMVHEHPELNAHWYIVTHRDRFSEAHELAVKKQHLDDRIHFLFDASDAELSWLYQNARALVHPSRAEGFGIPPLEALSFGKPIIVAKTTSLPEILGTEAVWISPDDSDELYFALSNVLKNTTTDADGEHAKSRQRHARQFSWQAAALSTQNIYKSVL